MRFMGNAAKEINRAPTGPVAPATVRPLFPPWLLAVLLGLMAIGLYWPATRNGFVSLDDPDYVTANSHVQGGLTLENIQWAFTSVVSGNWHPATMLSLMLDGQLFGLKPWAYHLTNILLHALNTALVFWLLRGLTGALWRSALVAALFAAHPLHVESVAWVAERKDVLSTFFGLLALICYVRCAQSKSLTPQRSTLNYCLALLLFALSLMSKATLVTLPCVMLLLEYWPLQRLTGDQWRVKRIKELVWEKIPFFALTAAASVATIAAQKQGGAVIPVEDYPLAARLENVVISYCRYLGKMFCPADLAVFYPHASHWPVMDVAAAVAVLCAVTALAFWRRVRFPFLLMGWLWFIGTLVPVIGLMQVGKQAIADRYMYVPSLGLLIVTVWGAHALARRWRCEKVALTAGLAALAVCGALTRQQIGHWKDSETLFRHTLEVTKNNFVIHYDLGVVLFGKGRRDEAMEQFQETVRLAPAYADAHVNLGVVLLNQGRNADAIQEFQEAIRLRPNDANAHFNLGVAFFNEAEVDEAIGQFQDTLRLNPQDTDAQSQLARASELKVKLDSLASDPAALNNLAWELATSPDAGVRNGSLAVKLAKRACEETQYRVTVVVGTLAAAYAEAGRFDEAVATGQRACALASELGETNLLTKNRGLLTLYRAHQAYHGPAQ
jgi:protein O-mannosyl-transferase